MSVGEGTTRAARLEPKDEEALDAFAAAARRLVRGASLDEALAVVTRAAAAATRADVAIARTLRPGGTELVARAVSAASATLAAELEGTSLEAAELEPGEAEYEPATEAPAPTAIRRAAARAGADVAYVLPVLVEGAPVASLELLRRGPGFGFREIALARLGAAHVELALRLARGTWNGEGDGRGRPVLELVGEALAAGADESETAE